MTMQFEKTKPGATPIFPGAPKNVYTQTPGHVNPDARNGSAGGEVSRETIAERGGALLRPSLD
jgi:hypothetical protein